MRVSEKLRSLVTDEHHHGHGVDRRFDEPIMPVEAPGFLILVVNQHEPNPDGPGHLDGLEHEVLEERDTETQPVVLSVDRDADGTQLLRLVANEIPRGE